MTTSTVVYEGHLRTKATHKASNNHIFTDAPVDNFGKGENFSPTDLVATALASCMMTIMGIKADAMGVDLVGMSADVEKIMSADPRRISEIKVNITVPSSVDEKTLAILKAAAETCPVAKTLSADVKQTVVFSLSNN